MDRRTAEAMSKSLREPQLEPYEQCLTVLQDHGAVDGGWGPVAVLLPWLARPQMFVYTGSDPRVETVMADVCRALAQSTGKPTRLVRYTAREDIAVFGGFS